MELTNFKRNRPPIDLGNMMYGKIPPQAKELEMAVLGAIMIEKQAYNIASEILRPECFYVDAHQKIFTAFKFLDDNHRPIDELTLIEALKTMEALDLVGGPYYIIQLTKNIVSAANIEIHSRIVLEKFILREMIRMSGETINSAYLDGSDFYDLIEQHEKTLSLILSGNIQSNFSTSVDIGSEAINRIYFLQDNPGTLIGVNTGYPVLNKITCGWRETDLIILAARPSVGKTAFVLNLLRSAATGLDISGRTISEGVPVGMFSLEMSKGQLWERLLAAESRVFLDKVTQGKMSKDELNKVVIANKSLSELKIFIDDTGGITMYELRSKARKMVSKHGCKLIIVDYLQLMKGDATKNQNREQEISNISRDLKSLAKELKVPIIALSQMSREVEKVKREPQLSDLRDSGAIEQDADIVIFGWRDDYQVTVEGEASNTGYWKISKHRNGGLDKLAFRTDMRVQTWFDPEQWVEYEKGFKYINNLYINVNKNSEAKSEDEDAPF